MSKDLTGGGFDFGRGDIRQAKGLGIRAVPVAIEARQWLCQPDLCG